MDGSAAKPHEHAGGLFLDLKAWSAWYVSARRQEALDRYLAEFDFRQNNCAKLGINDNERTY